MSKTPISILNELTVRINIVPQYELLTSDGINTHMSTFHYRLTAGKVIAYGKARTKIDAKHEAARSALEMLAELGFYHPSHPTPSSSPVHMQVNAISTLHEMCAKNIIPTLEFALTAVLGPAHFRQFTVECKIANMVVSATDKTKKKAKQLSAQKMLDQLMDTVPEVLVELKSRDSLCTVPAILLPEDDIAACSELTQMNKKKVNYGLKIPSNSDTITNVMKEKGIDHTDLWKDISEWTLENLIKLLERLELTMNFKYIEHEQNKITCIIIDSEPAFVVAGINPTKSVATNIAIENAYDLLTLISK